MEEFALELEYTELESELAELISSGSRRNSPQSLARFS